MKAIFVDHCQRHVCPARLHCLVVVACILSMCNQSWSEEYAKQTAGAGHHALALNHLPSWIPTSAQIQIRKDVRPKLMGDNLFVSERGDAIIEAFAKDSTIRFLLIPKEWEGMRFKESSNARMIQLGYPMDSIRSIIRDSSFSPCSIVIFGYRTGGVQMGAEEE